MEIKKSAIIGLGAIGAVYGSALFRRYGKDFSVIADGKRAQKIKTDGVRLNGERFDPEVISPDKTTLPLDLIILCVKNYSLAQAIEDIRPFVTDKTLILPLLNGVTASEELQKAFPDNQVFYGLCVYVDAVRSDSGVINQSLGIIRFGNLDNTKVAPEVQAVQTYLEKAGLVVEVCPDMQLALWNKWMLNVGCNQVSAVSAAPYAKMTIEPNMVLLHEAMLEVVALAKASGIALSEADALLYEERLRTFSPDGKTSMLQDVEAKRKTEVEYFSGTVIRLGKKFKVPTPVNHVLYYLLKAKEQMY